MGNIKILSDRDGVYEVGSIVGIMDFINSYLDCCTDDSLKGWIERIPMPDAVKFIAEAWGIDYKFA